MSKRKKYSAIGGIVLALTICGAYITLVRGATNISSQNPERYSWNDAFGWADYYVQGTVTVTAQKIEGYASSSAGEISLDCATTGAGNICSQSDYKVINDGNGNLSGWGWNDVYGWISFYCGNNNGCGTSNYRVYLAASSTAGSVFYDYAWNDVAGWISFNCGDSGGGDCSTSNYKVFTTWLATPTNGTLESSTIDTGVSSGAQLNSVLWKGNQPSGTSVRFQFAVSNSLGGSWEFKGPYGTSNTYYITDPGTSKPLSYEYHNNFRYFRYRAQLISDAAQTVSPRVDDVIVNWSK